MHFEGGLSVAETRSSFYPQSNPARVEPWVFTAAKPKFPTQMHSFYDCDSLPAVQSGMALNRSYPAVAEVDVWTGPRASGYFDLADFSALVARSNFSNYSTYPLKHGQQLYPQFVSQVHNVNFTAMNSTSAARVLYHAFDPTFNGTSAVIVNNATMPGLETSLDIQWISVISRARRSFEYHSGCNSRRMYSTFSP